MLQEQYDTNKQVIAESVEVLDVEAAFNEIVEQIDTKVPTETQETLGNVQMSKGNGPRDQGSRQSWGV